MTSPTLDRRGQHPFATGESVGVINGRIHVTAGEVTGLTISSYEAYDGQSWATFHAHRLARPGLRRSHGHWYVIRRTAEGGPSILSNVVEGRSPGPGTERQRRPDSECLISARSAPGESFAGFVVGGEATEGPRHCSFAGRASLSSHGAGARRPEARAVAGANKAGERQFGAARRQSPTPGGRVRCPGQRHFVMRPVGSICEAIIL
jgi:hypothetical protein